MSETIRRVEKSNESAGRRQDSPAKPSIVRIVGTGDGIVMRIGDQDGRWSDIVRVLANHLTRAEGFFQGERVAIEIGARLLTADDLQQIADVLAGYNIAIWAVRTSNPETRRMVQEIGLAAEMPDSATRAQSQSQPEDRARWEVHLGQRGQGAPVPPPQDGFQPPQQIADSIAERAIEQNSRQTRPGEKREERRDERREDERSRPPSSGAIPDSSPDTIGHTAADASPVPLSAADTEVILAPPYIHRGTLRSGQVFRHAGTVMILGDVNPGAEVISGGDIFVWGRLRGIVHAGAMGNERAVVCAIDFEPIQLRIAGYIAMSPRAVSNEPGRWFWRRNRVEKPEVARVIGAQIVVDVWDRE